MKRPSLRSSYSAAPYKHNNGGVNEEGGLSQPVFWFRTSALTQKAITAELHRLGHEARLESGDGYFYFLGLEPAVWLDKAGKVPSLTLKQWVSEENRAPLLSGTARFRRS
jgi:hypothetical protein